MRNQDHRARKIVERMDQQLAAVDVEMVGRLVVLTAESGVNYLLKSSRRPLRHSGFFGRGQ